MNATVFVDFTSNHHVFLSTLELQSKEKAIYEQQCSLPTYLSVINACFDMIKYSTVLPKPETNEIFISLIGGKSANL